MMRLVLVAVLAVSPVIAGRVDEYEDPPAEEAEGSGSGSEVSEEVITKQALHGAAQLHAHRSADSHQAMTEAYKFVSSTMKLADEAKDFALQKAARHAVRLDKVAGEQHHSSVQALKASARRDRLVNRAGAVAAYKNRADLHQKAMIADERKKTELEKDYMESAVGSAHENKIASENWKAADAHADAAVKVKTTAEAKYEKDKEIAQKDEDDSLLADKEAKRKAAAAKALADRSETLTARWEEANQAKTDRAREQKAADTKARTTSEQADTSERTAEKATEDRNLADQELSDAIGTETVAKRKCKLEGAVAHQTVDDASAATEVHAQRVEVANTAGAEASDARKDSSLQSAAEKAAAASEVAAEAAELSTDSVELHSDE